MEWNANDYSRQSSLQEAMANEILSRLELRESDRVLDVGCGDGKITARIAEHVPHGFVLGVDPSRSMIDFALRHFVPSAASNLSFEVADALRLPYPREFDLVVSFNALHWVREQEAALHSIGSTLRPGGRAILRLVCKGERRSFERVIEDVRELPAWSAYFQGFVPPFTHLTPTDYRALAERAGFRVDSLSVSDESWNFGTREAFAAFCRATLVAWTDRLPEQQRDPFIEAVLDHYRSVVAGSPEEANTFKFYQMDAMLTLSAGAGESQLGA